MTTLLPTPAGNFQSSAGVRLLIQGFMLHIATIAGPIDVFRKKGHRIEGLRLFFTEYGLNLVLFALLQSLIFMYLNPPAYVLGEIVAICFMLSMSALQMMVDSIRKKIHVYHSSKYEAGISVREAGEKCWAFFNHYALPVGRKHGVHLRVELHKQAKSRNFLLFCYAQNIHVAQYYLREHPAGVLMAGEGKRPLLVWDYRETNDRSFSPFEKASKKIDLLGFHSARNSGSLPLL